VASWKFLSSLASHDLLMNSYQFYAIWEELARISSTLDLTLVVKQGLRILWLFEYPRNHLSL